LPGYQFEHEVHITIHNAAFSTLLEVVTLMGVEDARPARCWVASASILSSSL